jgi:hypothetical protein
MPKCLAEGDAHKKPSLCGEKLLEPMMRVWLVVEDIDFGVPGVVKGYGFGGDLLVSSRTIRPPSRAASVSSSVRRRRPIPRLRVDSATLMSWFHVVGVTRG